jgi:hypothetical protein
VQFLLLNEKESLSILSIEDVYVGTVTLTDCLVLVVGTDIVWVVTLLADVPVPIFKIKSVASPQISKEAVMLLPEVIFAPRSMR